MLCKYRFKITTFYLKCYDFLHLEVTLPFAKSCYTFEEKKFFFCNINFMKKCHSELFKNEPENIP